MSASPSDGRTVVLLGPQRFGGRLPDVVASLGIEGRVATVTAGWREREDDDAALDAVVGGAVANLRLHARFLDVVERDPSWGEADRARRDRLEELQSLYLLRLDNAIRSVHELARRAGDAALLADARADAVEAVRALDEQHLRRVTEVDAAFHEDWPPHERPVIVEHREAIAARIAAAGALAVAGGHVGVLVHCLHVFNVAAALGDRPVVAWSAGAMAISERVVLFHDLAPHGPGHAELLTYGIGLVRGIVPLPHAHARLLLDDPDRMALLARRFAPRTCVLLDHGARLDCPDGDGSVGRSVPVVAEDGTIVAAESADTADAGDEDDAGDQDDTGAPDGAAADAATTTSAVTS